MTVFGVGAAALLQQGPLTAFFASRQCPGGAIRATIEWAVQQRLTQSAAIGGFHSPLERSVLRLLLEAGSPVVVVLARPVAVALLSSAWREALAADRMAVVSRASSQRRLTERSANDRNELAARLANRIVIAHASPGGQLARQCARWREEGLDVRHVEDCNGAG